MEAAYFFYREKDIFGYIGGKYIQKEIILTIMKIDASSIKINAILAIITVLTIIEAT